MLERSTYTESAAMPSSTPSGPVATASTSTGPGRELRMMSLPSAASLGVAAQSAPISSRGRTASRSMSLTLSL